MVNEVAELDEVFHALAHPVRRGMLARLAEGELNIGELAEPLNMSLVAASKHVRTLERAGLVHRTVRGRNHVCRLDPAPLAGADAWLGVYRRYWTESLDALERLFNEEEPG
jgi:DNA-binding transcriptional ArsR family regulator